jgi:adenylosuccinate lyase
MPKTKFRVKSSDWEQQTPVFTSITPLDGRNYHKIKILAEFFSEFSLNRRRVEVEIRWLIFLSSRGFLPKIPSSQIKKLEEIIAGFDLKDMAKVRAWEKKTNHDVKAIEYFLDDKFSGIGLKNLIGKLHWGLAAEDVNNLAVNLNLRDYVDEQLLPLIGRSLQVLTKLILDSKFPMLGRTHGQPAEVTVLGKELAVFLTRFKSEIFRLQQIKLQGKVAGAVGSFADQYFCFPSENWPKLTAKFVALLGLDPVTATTQILPYDSLLVLFSSLLRLQNIAVDLVQNLWWYVSFGYFAQKKKMGEVGSSSMPQKINPIYLEGAEGGFEQSNALFEFYIRKLSKSRLQRDLSDSTIRRSFGIAFGFSYLSWQSLEEALSRLSPQPEVMLNDLNNHWEVLIGPVLSYLRMLGYKQAYEFLVLETRGKTLTKTTYKDLVSKLKLEIKDSRKLKNLTPQSLIKPSLEVINEAIK